ncbi:MAG: endonuclease VII domain-containing protein [Actinomycetota bacterium]
MLNSETEWRVPQEPIHQGRAGRLLQAVPQPEDEGDRRSLVRRKCQLPAHEAIWNRRRFITGDAEAQQGLCALCRERPARHVDHLHETGTIRGVLCFSCNRGLGKFGDDPEVIRSAIAYLRRPA